MSDLQHRLTSLHADSIVKSAKRTREFIAILTVWLLLIVVGAFVAEQQLRTEAKDQQEVFHAERL